MSRFLTNQKPWIEDLVSSSLTFEFDTPTTGSESESAPDFSSRNLGSSFSLGDDNGRCNSNSNSNSNSKGSAFGNTSTNASTNARTNTSANTRTNTNSSTASSRRRSYKYITRTAQLVRGPEYISVVPTPTINTNGNGNGNDTNNSSSSNNNNNKNNSNNKAIRFIITDGTDTIPLIVPWSTKRNVIHSKLMNLLEPIRGRASTSSSTSTSTSTGDGNDSMTIRRVLRPGCMVTVRYYSVGVTSFVRLPPYFPTHDHGSTNTNTNRSTSTAARFIQPPICSLCLVIESDPFVIRQWNQQDEGYSNDRLGRAKNDNGRSNSSISSSASISRPFSSILPFSRFTSTSSRSTSISISNHQNTDTNININRKDGNGGEEDNVRPCIENIGCEGCGIIGSLRDIHENIHIRQALQLLQNDPIRIQEQIIRCHSFRLFGTCSGNDSNGYVAGGGYRKRKIPGSMTTVCSLSVDESIQEKSSNSNGSGSNDNDSNGSNYNKQICDLVEQMNKEQERMGILNLSENNQHLSTSSSKDFTCTDERLYTQTQSDIAAFEQPSSLSLYDKESNEGGGGIGLGEGGLENTNEDGNHKSNSSACNMDIHTSTSVYCEPDEMLLLTQNKSIQPLPIQENSVLGISDMLDSQDSSSYEMDGDEKEKEKNSSSSTIENVSGNLGTKNDDADDDANDDSKKMNEENEQQGKDVPMDSPEKHSSLKHRKISQKESERIGKDKEIEEDEDISRRIADERRKRSKIRFEKMMQAAKLSKPNSRDPALNTREHSEKGKGRRKRSILNISAWLNGETNIEKKRKYET